MEDKKYTDSDINTVSPSVSNTDLLEEDMMEDLISNVSTDKEKIFYQYSAICLPEYMVASDS